MKLPAFCFTVFLGLSLLSQAQDQKSLENDLREALKNKAFTTFQAFKKNYPEQHKGVRFGDPCNRQLTPDFYERIYEIELSVPDEKDPRISSLYTFSIFMIASDQTIISYELFEHKNKKVEEHWEEYLESLETFKNDSLYTTFQQSFQNTFHAELNESDLFVTDFVFGSRCGYTGGRTKGTTEIDRMLAANDKEALLQWLRSPNTEKQLYAVQGLLQLEKKGTPLTEEERQIITFIKHKKGMAYACSGCIHMNREITELAKEL